MASEPRYSLKSVTARIELEDYARILQQVDGLKLYKDVSECVRYCISHTLSTVDIDEERKAWIKNERARNVIRRQKQRGRLTRCFRKMADLLGVK